MPVTSNKPTADRRDPPGDPRRLDDAARLPSAGGHRVADDERPLESYALLMSVYAAVVAVVLAIAGRRDRLPQRPAAADLVLTAAATQRLSRLVTKDRVTSVVRAPFTAPRGEDAAPREVDDTPRGRGLRRVIGELLVCPFCISQWIATAFAAGLLFAPRATRWIAGVFTAVGASDYLQFAYKAAERSSLR